MKNEYPPIHLAKNKQRKTEGDTTIFARHAREGGVVICLYTIKCDCAKKRKNSRKLYINR